MAASITLAERLKALRSENNMGIRELGRAVGVTGMHISNIEKSKSSPSPELVQKIARALNANVDELLYLAEQIDPEVVEVIHNQPYVIPSFLRSAKNLTPAQWEKLQKQVEKMNKEN